MKKTRALLLMTLTAGISASIGILQTVNAAAQRSRYSYTVEEKENLQRSLAFSAGNGNKTFELDNINGSIRVTGYDGRTVELSAVKTIRATTQDRVAVAKQDVTLDITENADTVRVYVNEPGRCNCRDGSNNNWNLSRRNPGYRVDYDFEVRVPRQAALFLRTINEGDVHVSGMNGDFDVDNVNGDVEMLGLAGSGRAYALNGEMKVTFTSNPKAESYFGSLNGDVTVTFKNDLAADLLFKTFNGGVYTDFQLTSLPAVVEPVERRNGKLLYSRNQFAGFRVGRGGPQIKLDGFNGNIRVLGAQ